MKTSESIKEIAPAFVKAQMAFQAATKDKTATVTPRSGGSSYEYKYNDLASVIDCVRDALNVNGIALLQSFTVADGFISAVTRFVHASGEWYEDDGAPIPCPSMATPQAFGSAYTYSKRYGLQAFSGLPSEDDDAKKVMDESTLKQDTAARIVNAKVSPMQEHIDAFAALPKETQDVIKEHAATLIHLCKDGGDMVGYIREQEYDTESELALWTQLPSNVRSAYKQQKQVQALKKAAPALASQGD